MEFVWSVSKLSTESVGRRRELNANSVHTADADAIQLDSCVASAVCIGLQLQLLCQLTAVSETTQVVVVNGLPTAAAGT